jgi:hypothetical protein
MVPFSFRNLSPKAPVSVVSKRRSTVVKSLDLLLFHAATAHPFFIGL